MYVQTDDESIILFPTAKFGVVVYFNKRLDKFFGVK